MHPIFLLPLFERAIRLYVCCNLNILFPMIFSECNNTTKYIKSQRKNYSSKNISDDQFNQSNQCSVLIQSSYQKGSVNLKQTFPEKIHEAYFYFAKFGAFIYKPKYL